MHPLAYIPNPNSPLERQYGGPGHYGSNGAGWIAGVGSEALRDLLADPDVQRQMAEFRVECKNQAKLGVSEWGRENWYWLVAGGIGLVTLNFIMLSWAVLPAVQRGVRR
jgi:hypothetical protein